MSEPTEVLKQRVREMAADTMRALEELRRTTGVDEWDEGDWRSIAYSDAYELLGEDRYAEIMGEVNPDRYLLADDVVFTIEHAAGHIRTMTKEQVCADMAEYVARQFDLPPSPDPARQPEGT